MPYINLASHNKLIHYFNGLNDAKLTLRKASETDVQTNLLKDINRLDEIAKNYKKAILQLQNLSDEYENIHKKVRVSLRKLGIANVRKISKSS